MSKIKRCKHCHAPIPPDGKPLPILRPTIIRALIEIHRRDGRYRDVSWDSIMGHELQTLGISKEVPRQATIKIKSMRAAQRKRLLDAYGQLEHAERTDTDGTACRQAEAKVQDAIRDASRLTYEIDRKEWRLTEFGAMLAEWYCRHWERLPAAKTGGAA